MENTKVTERNLLNIIIVVLAIAVIIAIAYNLSFFSKHPGLNLEDLSQPKSSEDKIDSEEEYKRIIEKSKTDYNALMEQTKSLGK
ncbi:MAG: hypothetical protein WC658_05500 [Candidatus Omnitrophota bacterium]